MRGARSPRVRTEAAGATVAPGRSHPPKPAPPASPLGASGASEPLAIGRDQIRCAIGCVLCEEAVRPIASRRPRKGKGYKGWRQNTSISPVLTVRQRGAFGSDRYTQ